MKRSKKYRIVALVKVYNEIQKDNLERFIRYIQPLVDEIVAYDDGSTDGSYELLLKHTKHVIRAGFNDFSNELIHKEEMLQQAMKLKPDFLLWLDVDEVLSANAATDLPKICAEMIKKDLDGMAFQEVNLWRSHSWARIDNAYGDGWFNRIWRARPNLTYGKIQRGLHQLPYPSMLKKIERSERVRVIHYGFADDEQILRKYLVYRSHGQSGWALRRLIDEEGLTVVKVDQTLLPEGLRRTDKKPLPRSMNEWYALAEQAKDRLLRPTVSIVCLVYKSTSWLQFAYDQVLKYTDMSDKEFFFVANDATDAVKGYLYDHYIPHYIFDNTPQNRKEWYINNVYRAWNFGAEKARGDYIVFINSDMGLSPGWLERLLEKLTPNNCVCARLVESGKLPSGEHALSKNFGQSLETYDEQAFLRHASSIAEDKIIDGGLFMPLLIRRSDFLAVGGYPEGNVVPGSDPFQPRIAKKGEKVTGGDVVLMEKLAHRGVKQQTTYGSVVYHFQEGEMDDPVSAPKKEDAMVAVVNDYLSGRMGERTMWNFLTESLPLAVGLDQTVVGEEKDFESRIRQLIDRTYKRVQVIIQNASFIERVDKQKFTLVYLQDNLRAMGNPSSVQEENLAGADIVVTNARITADDYLEYNFEIIPIGVNAELFSPKDKQKSRQRLKLPDKLTGIFVGDLSPVKGWAEIEALIKSRPEIHWIVVTKDKKKYQAKNVTLYRRVNQTLLSELYNASDFFTVGSPVETQCLAAIEAALTELPILMRPTGIFGDFSEIEQAQVGVFTDNLSEGLPALLTGIKQRRYRPRQTMISKGLTVEGMTDRWYALLTRAHQASRVETLRRAGIPWHQTAWLSARRRLGRAAWVASLPFRGLWWIAKTVVKGLLPKETADRLYLLIKRDG